MKKLAYLVLGAVALALLIWWVMRPRVSAVPPVQPAAQSNVPAAAVPLAAPARMAAAAVQTRSGSNQPTDTENRYRQGLINKAQAVQEVLQQQNAKSLDLYGRVVDQDGQPVVGAKVRGSVLLNASFASSGGETHYTETDSQGRFSFLGIHGMGLGVLPQKDGYIYDAKRPSTRPEDYQPAPNNPVVFTMWKLKGAEPMVHDRKLYGINPDGRAYTLDLVGKKKLEGENATGDLVVRIKRPAQIKQGEKFDWSFTLSAVDGGILEAQGYLNEAPEGGYQPAYDGSVSASDPNWQPEVQRTFFFKSRGGKAYGHCHITIIPSYQSAAAIEIESYVNPASSRNLEFDPAKEIQ